MPPFLIMLRLSTVARPMMAVSGPWRPLTNGVEADFTQGAGRDQESLLWTKRLVAKRAAFALLRAALCEEEIFLLVSLQPLARGHMSAH